MAQELSSDIEKARTWSTFLSVLMIIAGILAIAAPLWAGVGVTALVGWLLLFSGVLHLIYAFRGGKASAVVWEILLAVIYGLVGFYILANPSVGLASLTLVIAFYLLVEAILEFALSYQLRGLSGSGWLMFDGIITLILALLIWASWPSSSVWVIGTLVGVSMLFSGIARVMLTSTVRRMIPSA